MGASTNKTGLKGFNGKTIRGYIFMVVLAVWISGCSGNNGSHAPPENKLTDYSTWMTELIDVIGSRTLREICIPGGRMTQG